MDVRAAVLTGALLAAGPLGAQPTGVSDFIGTARDFDFVVLGEIHDNPEHHRNHAEIVEALQPAALVFEMIPQDREDDVNRLRSEGAGRDDIAAALDWEASGWPDFAMYAPILEAAPDALVFGAALPVEDVRRAVSEGAAEVFGVDAEIFGLDVALDPDEQAAREATQAAAHCDALPADMLPGMVEAQRLRDAALANSARWARTISGGQVVVITGTGHADRLRGMPAKLLVADPGARILSLGQFEAAPDAPEAFDAWMMAAAPERDDPCAVFRDRPAE